MKKSFFLTGLFAGMFVMFCISINGTKAASADQALGVWLTKSGSHVRFHKCGGKLCGKVIKRLKPEELDTKNKNPKLRGRKILGINLMYGLAKDKADRWKGKLYNPEDGKTYAGFVTVLSASKVKMEGCVARVFCKKQTWSRIK